MSTKSDSLGNQWEEIIRESTKNRKGDGGDRRMYYNTMDEHFKEHFTYL
jgi:hypothetical protein